MTSIERVPEGAYVYTGSGACIVLTHRHLNYKGDVCTVTGKNLANGTDVDFSFWYYVEWLHPGIPFDGRIP